MKYSTPGDHNIIVEQFKIYVIKQVFLYISILVFLVKMLLCKLF